jgi:transposase
MAKPILDDELWSIIEPLLPAPKPRRFRYPGRKPVTHRQALSGILFILKTGLPWNMLPVEMGCGSGVSCWRRLREWQRLGVWQRLHEVLLAQLHGADQIDWDRALVDSSSIRALRGGEETGPSPVDRRKKGSKHHVLTDAKGIPLSTRLTRANRNDITQLLPLVEGIPPVRGRRGRPKRRPKKVQGDRGYDSEGHREALRRRGITPVLARRRKPHGSGLGKHRWPVERTLAWEHQFPKLRMRAERTVLTHQALFTLATALICWNALQW